MTIGLLGLGAVGAPIAHKLYLKYGDSFVIVTDDAHRREIREIKAINGDEFDARVAVFSGDIEDKLDVLILSVKNYDLISSIEMSEQLISEKTVLIPLENGIWACRYLRNRYRDNIVAECYVRGPDTKRIYNGFEYTKPGVVHIGTSREKDYDGLHEVYEILKGSGLSIFYEDKIKKMVWSKWMLNVAGNTVTALTGASYRHFADSRDLQMICRRIMKEFLLVADTENVGLSYADIDETIDYFVSFRSDKITSMLQDVLCERRTENEYITGELLRIAEERNIDLPINKMIYSLMKIKESVYMERKKKEMEEKSKTVSMKAGVKKALADITYSLEKDEDLVENIRTYTVPALHDILSYTLSHSAWYKKQLGNCGVLKLPDFPVMNKTLLNEHYDEIFVPDYRNVKTHSMHTSGSTGIPFTVVQNLEKRDRHIADLKYFGELAGYKDHDPLCYLRAKPTATQEEQREQNIWQLDICNLSRENLVKYYHTMVDKHCTALMAYPSTLDTAVTMWSQFFTNESDIKTIISTSETLTTEVREKLKAFFGDDVRITARYSNTEQGVLGQEFEEDKYVINWASYFIEILKMDSDEPAAEGELGRIIVTDLYNLAFPLIRYDTGDVAKMVYPEKGLPYLENLYGRRMDLIYDTDGGVVSPFLLCRTMRLTKGIEQWQFIQRGTKEYCIRVAVTNGKNPDLTKEIEMFKDTLGKDADITVEYVNEIPVLNSLKRKLIVSELEK